MNRATRRITMSGLFTAAGILLPVLFHAIGLGPVFLPMFWPVAISGFFLTPFFGFCVGIATPVLSFFFTGMPPVPILYKMIIELAVLAGAISFFARRRRDAIVVPLVLGVMISLAAGMAGSYLISMMLNIPAGLYALSSIVGSLPGIAVMLIIIPVIVKKLDLSMRER